MVICTGQRLLKIVIPAKAEMTFRGDVLQLVHAGGTPYMFNTSRRLRLSKAKSADTATTSTSSASAILSKDFRQAVLR